MHAVRNGLLVLGISICLGSSSAPAQSGRAPGATVPRHSTANPAHYSGATRAVATGTAPRRAVRQVAEQQPVSSNRRSDGLFGALTQPSGDAQGPSLLQRFGIGGGSSRSEEPDWEGVPYHRPVRSTASKASVPITDPNGARSRTPSRSKAPTSPALADLSIPVPPAEDAAASRSNQTSSRTSPARSTGAASPATASSRRSSPSGAAGPSATSTASNAFSSTESSRRSNRRSVDPLDAYLGSASDVAAASPAPTYGRNPSASTSAPDESEQPRVARRPIPTAGDAASSRRPLASSTPSLPPSLAASSDPSAGNSEASISAGATATALDVPATRVGRDTSTTLAGPANDGGGRRSMMIPAPTTPTTPASGADSSRASGAAVASRPSQDSWQPSTATPSTGLPSDTRTSSPPQPTATAFTAPSRVPTPNNPSAGTSDTARAAARTGSGSAATATRSETQLEVSAQGHSGSATNGPQNVSAVNAQPINVAAEIPGVRVITSGPAEIPIRRPATYEIRIENNGAISAPGALVRISLPRWIGIQKQQASRGDVNNGGDQGERQLLWQIEGLAPKTSETLTLHLSAVEARQFDVAVEWAVLPQSNVATIKVHEPKLELLIEGPEKVVYGQSQAYKVRVLNPGNGVAEDVVFTLSPNSTPQSQRIGSIPPGKEAHFEVELTARDLENLQIHGLAVGNSALKSEAIKSIEVIAAELEAVLSGPPLRYQDSSATYKLEIANLGDADCEQMTAVLRLPSGVRYEGGLKDAEVNGNDLQWRVDRLAAGASVEYEFACLMQRTGEQEIAFQCEGSAAGATSVAFTTEVEAIADLVLAIDNPPAPAPVGEEVVYEIVVRNRGSKAATDVETLAQFSHDIEPVRIDGGKGQLGAGQVLFDAIPRIEPGQEVRLQVIAKADKAGVHRFRTEIRSGGDALLVSEESTRYVELAGQRVSRRSSEKTDVK